MDQRLGMSDNLTRSLRVSRQLLGRGSNIHNANEFFANSFNRFKKKGRIFSHKIEQKN